MKILKVIANNEPVWSKVYFDSPKEVWVLGRDDTNSFIWKFSATPKYVKCSSPRYANIHPHDWEYLTGEKVDSYKYFGGSSVLKRDVL